VSAAASLVLPRERNTVPAARALAEQAMRDAGIPQTIIGELTIAISEACNNVVCHAGGDEYRVEVLADAGCCTIVVRDHGAGFELPDDVSMPPLDAEGGRGLALMRALVDDLDVSRPGGGGTVVTMVRRVP